MEKLLLKVLTFDLSAPSTLCFINLFAAMMSIPEKIKFMAQVNKLYINSYSTISKKLILFLLCFQYLCELSMLRASPFLDYTSSQISSAALALAFYTHGSSIWSKKMQNTFGYELDDLKELIINLNNIHFEAESLPQQAIQEKFKASKYMQASIVKPKKISGDEIDEAIAKFSVGDELNSTAENIESVRQKTELLFN